MPYPIIRRLEPSGQGGHPGPRGAEGRGGLTPLIDADGKPIVTKDGYQK